MTVEVIKKITDLSLEKNILLRDLKELTNNQYYVYLFRTYPIISMFKRKNSLINISSNTNFRIRELVIIEIKNRLLEIEQEFQSINCK